MNCQEFWENLPQRGELTREQSAHVAACATCGAQWEPHRALAEGLGSLGTEWRTLEAPPRVEAGLTAAFRAQAGYQVRSSLRHSWWTPVFAWASAAAAMIGVAVLLVHGYQAPAVNPTIATPRHVISQPPVQTASLSAADADSDDDSTGLGDGFVRLPNVPPIQPDEEYNVIHAEVSGSEMIKMGISVSEDRASEMLQADVVLGPDGTPRAVRLVPDGGTY